MGVRSGMALGLVTPETSVSPGTVRKYRAYRGSSRSKPWNQGLRELADLFGETFVLQIEAEIGAMVGGGTTQGTATSSHGSRGA